jgi:hypothetical protein
VAVKHSFSFYLLLCVVVAVILNFNLMVKAVGVIKLIHVMDADIL